MSGDEQPKYTEELPDYGDLIQVIEFIRSCKDGWFIDYDGHGRPVKDGKMAKGHTVYPSKIDEIPMDATHIMWFNR